MRKLCLFLLLLVAGTGLAGPSRMAVVPVSGRATLERLALAGVLEYARTPGFAIVRPFAGLIAFGSAGELSLDPDKATYLVHLSHARSSLLRFALWQDGKTVLAQLSFPEAEAALRVGAELERLPDRPHPIRLAPERSFARPATDTLVERLVAHVSPDSIRKQLQRLQDFGTRYALSESCRAAEQYIFDYFTGLGLDSVQFDSCVVGDSNARSVIGTKVGRRNPEKMVIICGHLDAFSEDCWNRAPGAEDDASGTVMAMEAARVLAAEQFDQTVKFCAFTGEELGLVGSGHYAGKLRDMNADVTAVLSFDMIAWPGGEFGVLLAVDSASRDLARIEGDMADLYTTLDHAVGSTTGDVQSFWASGYQATGAAEYGTFYPYYHTIGDTLGNLDMSLATEVAKLGISTLVTVAMSPTTPDSLQLWDVGTGDALEATWKENSESDLVGYRLMWGVTSGEYTDSLLVGRVSHQRISGLEDGIRYYVTLVALDSTGYESGRSAEQNAVPRSTPLAPGGVATLPFYYGMAQLWQRNTELDVAGYNVYRSTVSDSGYVKLNGAPVVDTTFRDSGLMSDTMYYYAVTAVDSTAHESPHSVVVHGKPITLDHGILLVDETRNGSGARGVPNDSQVDAFYHALLRGNRFSDWDVASENLPQAGDVGPYSALVWHMDDIMAHRIDEAAPGIANYLENGGKLWLIGFRPMYNLTGSGSYPLTFTAGELPYDGLHLAGAGNCWVGNFYGATGRSGYPAISVDSTKLHPSSGNRLPMVDVFYPRDADTVLTFNAALGDSFQGKAVGVRWLAGPGRIVGLGFPLYFTVDSEARALALKVLDDLGEPYGVTDTPKDDLRTEKVPTVVRDVLYLPSTAAVFPSCLLSVDGRRVLDLKPGRNTVAGLVPGVYFIRSVRTGTVAKVVITR